MLNEKEVAGKLKALAAEFRTLMEHKEYAKAKNRYDTALNIAVALELPEHTKEELFGKRDDSGHLTENAGQEPGCQAAGAWRRVHCRGQSG